MNIEPYRTCFKCLVNNYRADVVMGFVVNLFNTFKYLRNQIGWNICEQRTDRIRHARMLMNA